MRRSLGIALSLVLPASAQAADKPAAESLYSAGQALMREGRTEAACARFEASVQAEVSVGALLNVGRCSEQLGREATAWRAFRRAERVARRAGQTERAAAAGRFADALEPELQRIEIVVPAHDDLILRLDGEVIEPHGAFAVDPGPHRIAASAPGRQTWRREVVVDEPLERVEIPELERRGEDSAVSAPLVAGYAALGTGAAAIGVGAALGLSAFADRTAIDDRRLCAGTCSEEGRALASRAETKAIGATVAMTLGGAAVVGGVLTVILSPSIDGGDTALLPWAGPAGTGLGLSGRF